MTYDPKTNQYLNPEGQPVRRTCKAFTCPTETCTHWEVIND